MSSPNKERAEYLDELYRFRIPAGEADLRRGIWQAIVEVALQPMIPPESTVLDVGSGRGEFLNLVRAKRRIGVDLNPDNGKALTAGVEFHTADVRKLHFLDDGAVDVVFSSNFLEHLPDKQVVDETLREAARVLRPGGLLILMGPNVRIVPGAYWDFWDHLVPISDNSLCEALILAGLRIERVVPRFLPYTTRSRAPKAGWIVRLYLQLPFLWRVFGEQFLVVARKPR
jgi:SAM-dependent methyltransferase